MCTFPFLDSYCCLIMYPNQDVQIADLHRREKSRSLVHWKLKRNGEWWVLGLKMTSLHTFLHFELDNYLLLYNYTYRSILQRFIADSEMKRWVLFLIVPLNPGVYISKKPFLPNTWMKCINLLFCPTVLMHCLHYCFTLGKWQSSGETWEWAGEAKETEDETGN